MCIRVEGQKVIFVFQTKRNLDKQTCCKSTSDIVNICDALRSAIEEANVWGKQSVELLCEVLEEEVVTPEAICV